MPLAAVAAGIALAASGCADPSGPAINPKAAHALPGRQELLRADALGDWRTVQGSSRPQGAAILLGESPGKSTVLNTARAFRNGVLEFEVLRRAGRGPYTLAVRCGGWLLSWRAVYIVCRPDQVEACTGTADNRHPKPATVAKLEATAGPEHWRIVMSEGQIACYRLGIKVLTYTDADPREGMVAITADDCTLEVRGVSYRPTDE